MSKKILLIPIVSIFIAPWFFRLCYENIMIAIPNISINDARTAAWAISAIAIIFFGYFFLLWMEHKENNKNY